MSTILCIMDGFGIGIEDHNNAIFRAKTKFFRNMMDIYPSSRLNASGIDVGLTDGQIGNSEIGHLTIGSGRILDNDIIRITKALSKIDSNSDFKSFINNISISGGRCHVLGLCSGGGVHSHIDQMYKIVDYICHAGLEPIIHIITDGRDVSPRSALGFIKNDYLQFIHTVVGRYYAMDRDNRWDRTELAYNLIVNKVGKCYDSVQQCIADHYQNDISDEFILPSVIGNFDSKLRKEDGVIITNFRADRARQITSLIIKNSNCCDVMTFSKYDASHEVKTLIKPIYIKNSLGEVIANNNLKQLRIAETEKYAHVTYFFNGRIETPMYGEERILIESPKVTTYDLCPEMSAHMITEELIAAIKSNRFDFILVNYANADMLGHTGKMNEAIHAIEVLDECILKVIKVLKNDTLLITSDHGNVEFMYDIETKMMHTAHTLNPVPFVVLSDRKIKHINIGALYDIAPTILSIMGLPIPNEMHGSNLIEYF